MIIHSFLSFPSPFFLFIEILTMWNLSTKEDMIEMILISLNSQKAMFFSSSWHRIFPSIRKVMETYGNEKIVRVHPLVSQCVRRCQRLFHVKELIGFHFAYLNLKTAFGIYIQISSFSFQDIGRSIFNTPVYNTSLLVKFRKVYVNHIYVVMKSCCVRFDSPHMQLEKPLVTYLTVEQVF